MMLHVDMIYLACRGQKYVTTVKFYTKISFLRIRLINKSLIKIHLEMKLKYSLLL